MSSLIDRGYGVTQAGFNRPNLSVLLDRAEELFRETENFGDDFSFQTDKVLYQVSSVWLAELNSAFEVLEQVYNNSTPLKAEGNPLFNMGSFVGITRKQASFAEGEITITGTQGTQIPAGYQVKTADDIVFNVIDGGTIQGTEITLNIIAEIAGEDGNVSANTITQTVSPLGGITSLTNKKETAKGENQETQAEFRDRYFSKLKEGTGNNVDGVASALKTLSGVKSAVVYENDTDVTVDGILPHRIAPYVRGGDNSEIAKAIFDVKSAGIGSFGTTNITITDTQNINHTIGFSRPTEVDVYFKITLTKSSGYPADGDTRIKQAIVDYIDNLDISANVYSFKITSVIGLLNLEGLDNVVVQLSKDNSVFVNDLIDIDKNEVAVTTLDKVVII